MKKFFIIFALAAFCFTGCGLFSGAGDANANVNAAISDDPNAVPKFATPEEAIKKGDEYLDGGLYKMAINAFKQAVEQNQDLGEAHFKLGVAYSLEEDVEDLPPGVEGNSDKAFKNAVTVYKKYLKDNPEDAAAFFNLGRAQGKLFNDNEAADAIGKAVKLDDENALYKTDYAAALIKLARYGEAIKQLETALEMDPDNIYAEDLLEKAQAGKKRVDFRPPEKSSSNSNSNANAEEGPGTESNTAKPAGTPQPGKIAPPPPPPSAVKNPPPPPKKDQ
jgi:tetratricopeptide (TPR) repeat protein